MPEHARWVEVAEAQHGVVSRAQLREMGLSSKAVRRAVDGGRLAWLSPRVLAVSGSPDTDRRRALAAVLDSTDGAIALQSAIALLGLPGWSLEPLHVMTTRTPHRGSRHLGILHSSVRFSDDDVTTVDGIRVTTAVRSLSDLAGRLHPKKVADLCDDLLRRGAMTPEQLQSEVAELPPHGGGGGTRLLRSLALARPLGSRPTDSKLERRFEEILERAGESPFERQVEVGDGTGWVGRADFVDRRRKVIVEVQSDLFHSSLSDRRRDAERVARLAAAGWIVVEVTEHEIFHRADLVVRRVREARSLASRRAA